ncbi:hypothetical protein BGZ90_004580 [Linnemannia elongata]|nr:hypothetical protein BGZ90_004580 [Linnemannia elongata]
MDTVSILLGPIMEERKEPLERLTEWGMIVENNNTTYLPEITIMDAPPVHLDQILVIARSIVSHCPKLKNLRKRQMTRDPCTQGRMAFAIFRYMPPNTLESFQFSWCYGIDNLMHGLDRRLKVHTLSLKKIILVESRGLVGLGRTVGGMLRRYSELEVFRMSEHARCRFGVPLTKLEMEREWAAVKLQEIQLVFAMGLSRRDPDPSTLVNDSNPSKTSTPLLDSLYHRIAYLR